ncbi:MAG: pyrimidine 5'-nucleotidase [Alphaproteobacteria bacterium]
MSRRFDDITVWAFDLDNTLYPADCNLFDQVGALMGDFIAELLGVTPTEATKVQKDMFVSYGTTLRGLMEYHHVEPAEFLNYVHNVDMSPIPANPRLGRAITALPGKKYVFTNADRSYAERVLTRLEIETVFDGIFDIEDANYHPKPRDIAYDNFLARFDVDPARAVMIEDMAKNLSPAHARGMGTVWLPTGTPWSSADADHDHIDHVVDDLTDWVENIAGLSD